MAKKKKPTRKKKAAAKKVNTVTEEIKKIILGIIILVFIVATIAMIADFFINQRPEKKNIKKTQKTEKIKTKKSLTKPKPESKQSQTKEKEGENKIKYEVFDDDASTTPSKIHVDDPVKVKPVIKKNGLPLVAIIIDDIGYHRRNARALARLDSSITFAVLPFSPHGEELAIELHSMGNQIMLHLPMEPVEYPNVDSGPGSLLTDMSPDELIFQLKKNLDSIPYVVGVNNHMGSKLTPMSSKIVFFSGPKKPIASRTRSASTSKSVPSFSMGTRGPPFALDFHSTSTHLSFLSILLSPTNFFVITDQRKSPPSLWA